MIEIKKKKSFIKNDPKSNLRCYKYFLSLLMIVIVAVLFFLFLRESTPVFDGDKAFEELIRQVNFGPRVPGTESHKKTCSYLVAKLKQYTDYVDEQKFKYIDKQDSTKIYNATNIVASFNIEPKIKKRILLAAHWDTRPFSDQDPNIKKRKLPVPGANDGASGVAVLLELARLLSEYEPNIGVDIVFFDLEDMGEESFLSDSNKNQYAIGSAIFVKQNPKYLPSYGILLDMVGDKKLIIAKEYYSFIKAEEIVDKIWKAAEKVGSSVFINKIGLPVYDDHIVFLQNSISVVNLIHTPFPPYWHTSEDTQDKCSPESLKQVGNVIVEVIYNEQ